VPLWSRVPQGQVPQGRVPQGQVPQGQVPQGQVPQGQVPQGQVPQGRVPQGQVPQGQVPPQVHQQSLARQQCRAASRRNKRRSEGICLSVGFSWLMLDVRPRSSG